VSHDLVVAVVAAVVGATVAAVLSAIATRSRRSRTSSNDFAVMVYTLNQNSKSIGALELAVNKMERKIANFEGVLSMRMNYRQKNGD
jgi:hypothetical protein